MEAYDEGVLTRILVPEGASVPIGTPIAVIGDEQPHAAAAPPPVPAPDRARTSGGASPRHPHRPPGHRPRRRLPASPLARKLARERGIDLATVSGTGPGGRIVRADIEAAARERDGAQPAPQPRRAGAARARQPPAAPLASRRRHLSPLPWRRWPRRRTPRRSR